VVTPFLSDRDLALRKARYVRDAAGRLHEDLQLAPDSFIAHRAHEVLGEAVDLLERIGAEGLLAAIGDGTFGHMRRPADRGKGLDGVALKADGYCNPVAELLEPIAGERAA
jgi:beta-lysine 5,6-aminomutase alpha subunit